MTSAIRNLLLMMLLLIFLTDKDTKNNHGLMANKNTGTARFEMQELGTSSQEWPRWWKDESG